MNPANEASQAAKKAGLSYWSYMAKTYPGSVLAFVWPSKAKKSTRKEKLEGVNDRIRGKMGTKFLAGMYGLLHGRGAY